MKSDLQKYKELVDKAKKLYTTMKCYQAKIAKMAIEACEIRHGGISDGLYTLSKFADQAGIPRKTLGQWTLVYRNVIEKIDISVDDISEDEWKIACRVDRYLEMENRQDNVHKNTPRKNRRYKDQVPAEKISRLFDKFKNEEISPFQEECHKWNTHILTIKNNISKRDLNLANEKTLLELMENVDFIGDYINDYLTAKSQGNKKPYLTGSAHQ